jgi:hypothetical protein
MLRAFLIVWTLVAGVAAGSLMYIVRGGQEAPVVAIAPAKDKSAAVTAPAAPAAPVPVSTDRLAVSRDSGCGPKRPCRGRSGQHGLDRSKPQRAPPGAPRR